MVTRVRNVTVRFSESQYERIARMAAHEGVPISRFIREAAFARTVWQEAKFNMGDGPVIWRIHQALQNGVSGEEVVAALDQGLSQDGSS